MPRFRITTPDGRTLTVEAPQGASRDEVLRRAQAHFQAHPAPPRSTKDTLAGIAGNYLDAMIPGAAGAVRGGREVLLNAVRAPFSASEDFEPMQAHTPGPAVQATRQKRRKSVGSGKRLAVRVELGARRILKQKTTTKRQS